MSPIGASVVLLEGETGRGKTFAIQGFYEVLCERSDGYWDPGLIPTRLAPTVDQLLRERKVVRGRQTRRLNENVPWLWFGTCAQSNPLTDWPSLDIADQLDTAVSDFGYNATTAQLVVLGELGLDVAAAAVQADTVKAVFTAAAKSARIFAKEVQSWDGPREREASWVRALAVERALQRLGATRGVANGGIPTVIVLDDAHLAQEATLDAISAALVPGVGASSDTHYIPLGVAPRQSPIMVLVAGRPHNYQSPEGRLSPFARWLNEVEDLGIPLKRVALPPGLEAAEAVRLAREVFPQASQARVEALIQPAETGQRVNPLVLVSRLVEASGFVSSGRHDRQDALDAVPMQALATSPLDPIRAQVDALPHEERLLLAQLCVFGTAAPAALLSDKGDVEPVELFPRAIASGIVKAALTPAENDLAVVYLWDDLVLAYMTDPTCSVRCLKTASNTVLRFRCARWLARICTSSTVPAGQLGLVGNLITRVSRVLGEPWRDTVSGSATDFPAQVAASYKAHSQSWTNEELLDFLIRVIARPQQATTRSWGVVTASTRVRAMFHESPQSLVLRGIALHRFTMPQPDHLGTLLQSVTLDREPALWRLADVVPLVPQASLKEVLQQASKDESLSFTSNEVLAYEAGADAYISFWEQHKEKLTPQSAWRLSGAYVAAKRVNEAIGIMYPYRADRHFRLRIVNLYIKQNDLASAEAYLDELETADFDIMMKRADILIQRGKSDTAAVLLRPHCESNSSAVAKLSQCLTELGDFDEARRILESHSGVIPNRDDLLLSLRTRVPGIDRKGLQKEAEDAWRSGDFASAIRCLASGLADTVIVALWAEYVAAAGGVAHALDVMRDALEQDRRLTDTYVELAFELPDMASTEHYLRSVTTHSSRLELALARVNWLKADQPSIGAWLTQWTELSDKTLERLKGVPVGTNWPETRSAALTFDKMGDPCWALEVLHSWSSDHDAQGHYARLLVDYGMLSQAEDYISLHGANVGRSMAVSRAMLHLLKGQFDQAGEALAATISPSPQINRLASLMTRIPESRSALRASELSTQMRLYPLSVAILAASDHSDPDVAKAFRRAKRGASNDRRRALARHRTRWAIRGAVS